MAEHNLFRGGLSTRRNGFSFAMFPSTDVTPDECFEDANHKNPVDFSVTWGLVPGNPCNDTPLQSAYQSQHAYFRDLEVPLAEGDVINAVIMPRFTSLIDMFYLNCCPQPGLEMELRLRGNADSLGGTEEDPVPLTIATLDFGEVTWGSIIPLPEGPEGQPGAIYFNQNDMLQLVITSLPEDGIDWNCLRMALSPVMREYLRGDWIECLGCCGVPPAIPTPPLDGGDDGGDGDDGGEGGEG